MADIGTGGSAKVQLDPGQSLRVETEGGTTNVTSLYGAPSGTTAVNGSQTFGPYGVPVMLRVACASGSASYSIVRDEPAAYSLTAGEVEAARAINTGSRMVPPPTVTWWPFNEGTGTEMFDQNATAINANALGTTTGMWTTAPGLNGNGSVKVVDTKAAAVTRQIFNLATMVPGQTQLCVAFLLVHPTTPSGNGMVFYHGLGGDNTKGGWGVRVDSASNWMALEILGIGGSSAGSVLLNVNQNGLKLQGKDGANTATAVAVTLQRSAVYPGQMVVTCYAQPYVAAEKGLQSSQTLMTMPELQNGATALPGIGGGELTWFAKTGTDQATGFSAVMNAGYRLAQFCARRSNQSIDNIGARLAKEIMAQYTAAPSAQFTTQPASLRAPY